MVNGMWRKKQKQADLPKVQKDTLIIIGDRFDIWQGFNTNYAQFQAYYLAHRDAILKKLHIKKHTFLEQNGTSYQITNPTIIPQNPANTVSNFLSSAIR